MCGMFGALSTKADHKLDEGAQEIFFRLAVLNRFRGAHSIGLVEYTSGERKFHIKKRPQDSWDFVSQESENLYARWKKTPPMLLMGHCRFATRGKINQANAHPFIHGNIIGMHNGTIGDPDHKTAPVSFTNLAKFNTDSEALIYNFSKLGPEAALLNVNTECAGLSAYAIQWVNSKDRTLHFIRNHQRSLAFTKINDTIFWSSEKGALDFALRNMGDYSKYCSLQEFDAHKHYLFDLGNPKEECLVWEDWYEKTNPTYHAVPMVGAARSANGSDVSKLPLPIETPNHAYHNYRVSPAALNDLNLSIRRGHLINRGMATRNMYNSVWDIESQKFFNREDHNELVDVRGEQERREKIRAFNRLSNGSQTDIDDVPFTVVEPPITKPTRLESEFLVIGVIKSITEVKKLLKKGCCLCGVAKFQPEDAVLWVHTKPNKESHLLDTNFVCPSCIEDLAEDPKHWLWEFESFFTKDSENRIIDRCEVHKSREGKEFSNEQMILEQLKTPEGRDSVKHLLN